MLSVGRRGRIDPPPFSMAVLAESAKDSSHAYSSQANDAESALDEIPIPVRSNLFECHTPGHGQPALGDLPFSEPSLTSPTSHLPPLLLTSSQPAPFPFRSI
jgi:hypothetical protein